MTTVNTDNHANIGIVGRSVLRRIKKSVYKADYFLLFILFVYAVLGYLLLSQYQYKLSLDGISYISIAQKYLNGNYSEAINTYWSPLFSWLLVPFLGWSESPLVSVRLLGLLLGLITILSIRALAAQFRLSKLSKYGLTIGLLPFIIHGALVVITPDLLMLCLIAFYLAAIFNADYCHDKTKGIVCGALGGLAYLTKIYGFPFFIVHFLVFNGIHYCRGTTAEKQRVLKNLASGLITFLLISGSWTFVISSKSNHFTIGSAVNYNVALMAGDSYLPHYLLQLIEPAKSNATSVWEEPSRAPVGTWNPLASLSAFKLYAKRVLSNTRKLYYFANTSSVFLISIILFTVLFCLKFTRNRKATPLLFCLVTAIIYSSGYILIWVLARYIWIVLILFTITGYYFIDLLFRNGFLSKTLTIILVYVFSLSCILPMVRNLSKSWNMGRSDYTLSQKIDANYGISGNIASDYFFKEMSYLAFHNNYTYFGATSSLLSDDELQQTLREHDIDYYFVWRDSDFLHNVGFLSKQKEITGGEVKRLRIYDVKDQQ